MKESLRYNVAQYGSVIPILWGTSRVSVNVIDGYNYKPPKTPGKGGLTKGGAGNGSVDVAFGFCVGPIDIRANNGVWANAGRQNLNQVPLNWYGGGDGQAPDSTFASNSPNQPVVGYSGLFYATGTPLQLSGSVLPNFSVELNGFRTGTAGSQYYVTLDANPALILQDMLYDARIGIGFPAASDLSVWSNFCLAATLGFSLLADKQQTLRAWVEELLLLTTSAGVWSSGRFIVRPYSTGQLDNDNGAYYPNLTPVANLTDDDFLPWSTGTQRSPGERDPVVITRSDASLAINWITCEILDRSYWYDPIVQPPVFDQASIELFGVRTDSSVQAHQACSQLVGGAIVNYMLARKNRLRNTFQFRVGWGHMLLEPMDIVAITDTTSGLFQYPVRIVGVEEDDSGALTISAEELI